MEIGNRQQEGEHPMKKRIFTTLAIAAAIALMIPVTGMARPLGDSTFGLVSSQSSSAQSSPIVSEKLAGLNVSAQSGSSVVSEKTAGLNLDAQPSPTSVASGGSSFDWSNVGIGAGAFSASVLALLAVALVVRRRHHTTFAH
jgi:hypothetical protein